MISFRYHLSTLVAVFLALAVGVVLGGGPLSELGRSDDTPAADSAPALAQARAEAEQAESALLSAAPSLYAQGLDGTTVTVLRLPGVSDATEAGVVAQIEAAGGTAQTWQAGDSLVSANDKALVDTMGSQLQQQLPDGLITEGATTYNRIGELIAVALASPKAAGDKGSAKTGNVLDSLRTAKLITGDATVTERAPLVLVLAADPDLAGGVDLIHQGIISGLAVQSVGVVVATDAGAPLAGSLVEAKVDEVAAVVDGVDSAAGQVATVTALVRSVTTPGGSFGVSGEDGFLSLL